MRKLLYILLLGILGFSSCTKRIDFDLNTEKARLVVEASFTNDSLKHLLRLTETSSYYNQEPARSISGASVRVSDGTSSWNLTEESPGNYYTPELAFEENRQYTVFVEAEGKSYQASDFLNQHVRVDSVSVRYDPDYFTGSGFDGEGDDDKDKRFYSIFLYAQEPPGLGDNYVWKFWAKKPDTAWKDMTPTFADWSWTDDEFVDGNYPSQGWEVFTGIEESEIPEGTIIRVEMYKVSSAYYDFLFAMNEQTSRTGFFDGPPANIPSNVSNGALGFFMTAGVDTGRTVVSY